MYRYYKYLFYKLFNWAKKVPFEDSPEYSALASVALLLFMNFMTLRDLIDLLFQFEIDLPLNSWTQRIIFFSCYYGIHHFFFIYKKRYKMIEEEFKNESKEEKRKGTINTSVYIILTVGLLILTLYINNLLR